MKTRKTLIHWLGLLGVISFISYAVAVILLSIASLVLIMVGGYRNKRFVSLAVCATIALILMFVGAIGVNAAPKEYFGIFQRFSNLISANGFLAALGIYLFMGKLDDTVVYGNGYGE